ncbi:MAG: DUF4390 domain-containing protein [Proteobacteria bacterium]|jgi:hypothetical protein|nr:DUF4390 domain-containing protein [Pseudomonadota bacterium]
MTAFIMPVCAKQPGMLESLRHLLLFVAFLVFASLPARADDASITHARIVLSEEGYVLNADFSFDLNQKLIDALAHGVALHFVAELRIERPRWYWFDKLIVHRRLEYRLAYHAMTRSYRLNIGSLHRNFDSLADALHTMERIRNLHVAPSDGFDAKDKYEATLRFFHDTTLLPKPFQLSALANSRWGLDTGWTKWTFTSEMPAITTQPEEAVEEEETTTIVEEPAVEKAMPGATITE